MYLPTTKLRANMGKYLLLSVGIAVIIASLGWSQVSAESLVDIDFIGRSNAEKNKILAPIVPCAVIFDRGTVLPQPVSGLPIFSQSPALPAGGLAVPSTAQKVFAFNVAGKASVPGAQPCKPVELQEIPLFASSTFPVGVVTLFENNTGKSVATCTIGGTAPDGDLCLFKLSQPTIVPPGQTVSFSITMDTTKAGGSKNKLYVLHLGPNPQNLLESTVLWRVAGETSVHDDPDALELPLLGVEFTY